MATLTIRKLDTDLQTRLRVSAALHGRSIEDEVCHILRLALQAPQPEMGLGSRIHQRYVDIFGDEVQSENEPLALPDRSALA